MLANAIIQVGIFSALVTAISVPLGLYMARVFAGERTMLDPVLRPLERIVYRLCGIHPEAEETWVEYAVSMLLFSGVLIMPQIASCGHLASHCFFAIDFMKHRPSENNSRPVNTLSFSSRFIADPGNDNCSYADNGFVTKVT